MRSWNKLIFLGALLSVMLIISVVFSSGVVDVLTLSPESSPESSPLSSSSSPEVFVDPALIVKDYDLDSGYQIGDTFNVSMNVTDFTGDLDLYAWQINMSWDPSMLNVSNIIAGEFLNRVTPPNYTTSSPAPNGLGFVINVTDNATGYTAMGESILGGVPAISGNGTLVTIEFLIVDYGWTYLNISVSGTLPTLLLNSTLGTVAYDRLSVPIFLSDGYFRNVILGDNTDDSLVGTGPPDGDVDEFDLAIFADNYGGNYGLPGYFHLCDLTDDSLVGTGPPDGDVDEFDLAIFADNYGRT
jgi:hypothetical protein